MNIIRKNMMLICCLVSMACSLALVIYWLQPAAQNTTQQATPQTTGTQYDAKPIRKSTVS